jgi:TetR/AcrR family transcriptional repressor of lmrAB and yxaGH operons
VPKPKSDSRQRILSSTRTLLRRQGYHGTGVAQIIEHSGAPRGSVYFLFPGGKEQMAVEAVNEWSTEITALIRRLCAESGTAADWVQAMAGHFAAELRDSGFTEGLPVTIITLDSVPASAALTVACRQAYDAWLAALVDGLAGFGVPAAATDDMAKLMLAALEGAVVLCRVYQTTQPLQQNAPHEISLNTDPTPCP